MEEPSDKVGELVAPVRNRKRFLEASEEQHEEESNSRRQNLFCEWQEVLKGMGVPSKKGFIGNESQYNDMIDQGLADNFEDSLSGLGVDITSTTYNMSDAMLALPNVGMFKHEPSTLLKTSISTATSPSTLDESSQSNTTDRLFKLLNSDSYSDSQSPTIHQLLQQHMTFPTESGGQVTEENPTKTPVSDFGNEENLSLSSVVSEDVCDPTSATVNLYENNRFQYILGAATSVAMKVSEESLTYLNQGQSYEIKVKKLGDITGCQGKFYHTILRICFHERRLQYMEKEQISAWKQMRPGERILEIDVPLSYGISDVVQDPKYLNVCEFDWEPMKEIGVYIKVNCISTEFTPKKHGGEKGVPFRLQVETYPQSAVQGSLLERLNACACQIKVFKLKGADRKHKQDREKILKRSAYEISKYQRQCDCTILQEISPENLHIPNYEDDPTPCSSGNNGTCVSTSAIKIPTAVANLDHSGRASPVLSNSRSWDEKENPLDDQSNQNTLTPCSSVLDPEATPSETQMWLASHRFCGLATTFSNFTGMDLLRLSRTELIDICGLVDGIRLFNTLHSKPISPRLTLYLCLEPTMPYNAIYLKSLTLAEFIRKIGELMSLSAECIHDICIQGPYGINVLVTDEVVRNLPDESTFRGDILEDKSGEKYRILLRTGDS